MVNERPQFGGIFRVLAFAVCHLALLQPQFVSAEENSFPPFEDAAQDKEGMVWALTYRDRGELHTFDGQHWNVAAAPFKTEDEALPERLLRLPDGAVACLWRLTNDRFAITRHLKGVTSLVAPPFEEKRLIKCDIHPWLYFDSHGQFWVSGSGAVVDRIEPDGRVTYTCQIQPDQFLKAYDSGNSYNPLPYNGMHEDGTLVTFIRKDEGPLHVRSAEEMCNPILTVEDGRGRIWAWTYTKPANRCSLEGVLIFDGEKVDQQREFHGIQGKTFCFIGKKDEKHMWVGVRGEGLFEVDIDTFEASHAGPMPRMIAFTNVQMLFAEGGDWYATTDGKRDRSDLWRLRDGKWTQLVPKLEEANGGGNAVSPRGRLSVEKGFILRAAGAAPWFISATEPPARLDWRDDFKMTDAEKIFMMNDGTLLAIGSRSGVFHGKVSLPPKPAPPSRVTEFEIKGGWCVDEGGHAWCMLEDKPDTLDEWTGEKWVSHDLPPKMVHIGAGPLAGDAEHRIWMLSNADAAPVAYYDTRDGKWGTFPNLEEAYKSVKSDPPHYTGAELMTYDKPAYSADGKCMAFLGLGGEICYFDGAAWHHWRRGADFAPGGNVVDPPYFNGADKLCTIIGGATWQLDDAGAWHQMTPQPSPTPVPAIFLSHRPRKTEVPKGCVTESPESAATDNQGVVWLTWQHQLYKSIPDVCVTMFSQDELNPFDDGRRIHEAWVDPFGNAFLKTSTHTAMMISPKAAAPKASIAVEKVDGDSATARLGADPSGEMRFRWRLDDGPWQLTKEKIITLDSLANGAHALSVTAIDAELQTGPPATAKFEIKIDQARQISTLIQQLSDPDFAKRKAAVAALARQPAPALPALKAARDKAGDDLRWWIDVAIQEIESQPAKP